MSWDPRILTILEFLWMLVCINLQSFCIYQRSREALNWLRHRIEVKDKSLSEPCLEILNRYRFFIHIYTCQKFNEKVKLKIVIVITHKVYGNNDLYFSHLQKDRIPRSPFRTPKF